MSLRARVFAALLSVGLLAAPPPAAAEMSADEYQSGERAMTRAERAREAERIRQERERGEAIEREREEQAEQAGCEEQARLAARPLGVRLVEARCAVCHGPDALSDRRYGWLGWWSVLLRMEYIHGARFEPGERRVIVAHLASSQSAGRMRGWLEWIAAAAAVSLLLAAGCRQLPRARR